MLEIDYIISNKSAVIKGLNDRGFKNSNIEIDKIIELNNKRKVLTNETYNISKDINVFSEEIHKLIENKNVDELNKLKEYVKNRKKELSLKQNDLKKVEEELKKRILNIPNIPNKNVPLGKSSADNKVVYISKIDEKKNKKPHYDLIEEFNIIDFNLGIKLTGAGFPVYKNKGAKLQRALINFFLDEASNSGFTEYEVPIILNEDSFLGTGQLPDKENQMYKVENMYLIPTAEVPLTNLYRNVILNESDLPIKLTGYTPCFRREAGSWGKDVRGLNRLHQFDKVEIVEITKPSHSYSTLEKMRTYVEGIVKKLGLNYRVLALCTGDLGFNSAFTYDIEVYSVGQDKWLEVSSISNFETYQSNRLNLKYKDKENNKTLVHTLNGSALALPRIIAALLEKNYDGEKIIIPEVLHKYLDFKTIEK